MHILLCDVDGTLTETVSGQPFKAHPQDVKVLLGVEKGLKYYAARRYSIIGISNQGEVAAGYKTIANAVQEMQYTITLLPQLRLILFCPDFEGKILYSVSLQGATEIDTADLRSCRIPHPGMIDYVLRHYAGAKAESVYLVGDRPEDEQAAVAAHVTFCPADIWRDRFSPGIHEFIGLSLKQVRFLEGMNL